ncbi:MAG: protein kinase [Acidobacteriota bacterium]|nr:protein kinase [Acidobacteriota bacterium]
MENNNWQQIENIFHTALSLNDEERAVYLSEACVEDNSLREEVDSLIAAFEDNGEFLDKPAFDLGIKVLESDLETSLTGQTIGSYKILSKLGNGGMGEVYLAEDTRLNRKVALKFLSKALVGDKWAKRQLVKEAQAVAMLDHPNICPVYGIEEIGEYNFIVMQYIEGETLADLVRNRRLTSEQIHSLASQIVSAIEAAHARGIIHRDIKTGNIMVTASGQAKVLDFGLAKIIQPFHNSENGGENVSQFSQSGLVVGTVSYMSPEQLKAERLDYRTDIFSFGTVLYELASGEHPFLRKSDAETITAILTDQPASTSNFNNKAALSGIHPVIKKCLEKNREQRFQSASELMLELQNVKNKKPPIVKKPLFYRSLSAALVVLLLLLIGNLLYQRATEPRTLAVLPFVNESGDSRADYIGGEMAESLIDKISDSSGLRVKPYTQVSAYKNNYDSIKIGQILGVEAVLTGKIDRQDEELLVETKLVNTTDGAELWSRRFLLTEFEPLHIQNNISEIVISKLQSPAGNNGKPKHLAASMQENPEAFNYYLQGQYYWKKRDKENIQKAIDSFKQAIYIDPNYARAYAGLANAYVARSMVNHNPLPFGEASELAKVYAEKAISLDENISESHAALGVVLHRYEWNWEAAEKEYWRAIELNPDYAQTYHSYSHLLSITGRYDEALAQSLKFQELDPFSPFAGINIARVYYYARKYDEAQAQVDKALNKDPDNTGAKYYVGLIHLQRNKYEEALKIFEKLYSTDNKDQKKLTAAVLGFTYGKLNRRADAHRVLNDLKILEESDYIPPRERAIIYLGLNDKDSAISWLEKSFQERSSASASINVEPLFDELRNDQRFQAIVLKMNLKPNLIIDSMQAKF